MNSRSWRHDELGQLISHTLRDTVEDARPSPQVWLNIKRRLTEHEGVAERPRRWPRVAIPSFQAALVLMLLLVVTSTLSGNIVTREDDDMAIEPTAQVSSSVSPVVVTIDDHPSEPSPIVMRARDMAIRRALAYAVNRGVFEGTLRPSSNQPLRRSDTKPVQKLSLVRARY